MFKFIFIAIALFAFVCADNIDKDAQIERLENNPADSEGAYNYLFETSNGIQAQEAGNKNGVTGSSQYVSPEGIPILLSYTADENGYQPTGDHIPTPPPIPDYIIRSLEYIRQHPPKNLN